MACMLPAGVDATMRLLLLAIALLSVSVSGCASRAEENATPAAPPHSLPDGVVRLKEASRAFIGVEPVGSQKSNSSVTAAARVDFKDGAVSQIGAPLDGRMVAVHVAVGSRVKTGDPLVTLDCPDAAEIRAQVETARANLREARASLDRQERMLQQGVGIEREKIAAETRLQETQAEVERVDADAAFIGMGVGTTVVLRAPMTGTVINRKANVGLAVQKGAEPIIEIGDPSAVWIVADVFERDLPRIHEGGHASITLPSVDTPLEGRVESIGAVVATGLRAAPVRIVLESPVPPLRPGMYGRAELQAFDGDLTVPTDSILIKDGKESVVYVQKDELTFERRTVTVGQHVGGRIQIVSGLAPGDRVVVRGALLLDGAAEQLL
jgi:cobalt-zinc-cadmium efflux system membrane fusion protein